MKILENIKIFCIGLTACITLTACPSGSDDAGSGGITDPVVTPTGKTYNQNETIAADGVNKDITLSQLSAKIVSIEYSCSWMSVVSNSYSSGAPSVHLNVKKNTDTASRTCSITITTSGNNDKLLLQIKQDAMASGIGDIHGEKTDSTAYAKECR